MASIPLSPGSPAYPAALAALARDGAGPTLYLRGTLPSAPGVAIVGTRGPTDEARAFARTLARDLSEAGLAIWSGGARGIDAAAHEGALDAGGPTVMVAGGGLGRPYPPEHVPLFERILAAGGALLARVPDAAPPLRPGFLLRNEVLAALSVATVLVECGVVSGARSTTAAARRLGRPVCVVPHAPWERAGAGCFEELARGAIAVARAEDVLAAIRGGPARIPPRRRRRPSAVALPFRSSPALFPAKGSPLESPEQAEQVERVLAAITPGAADHADRIAEITGLPFRVVVGALLTLTLQAVVVEGPAGFYRRGRRS